MQEKTKKYVIDNGKSSMATTKIVGLLITDIDNYDFLMEKIQQEQVRINEEQVKAGPGTYVSKKVTINTGDTTIKWRSPNGAFTSVEKCLEIAENVEKELNKANLVADLTKGTHQGQLVMRKQRLKEGNEPHVKISGWNLNKSGKWVPEITVVGDFKGEKRIFFAKGFYLTVFVK